MPSTAARPAGPTSAVACADNLLARLIVAEHDARDADRDEQQRRQREHRVVGEPGRGLRHAVREPVSRTRRRRPAAASEPPAVAPASRRPGGGLSRAPSLTTRRASLGDAPRLGEAAARRERRLGVEDSLRCRCTPSLEVPSRPSAARAPAASSGCTVSQASTRARSATATPCPGDRRRRARAGRRSSAACSRDAGDSVRSPTGVSSSRRDRRRAPAAQRSPSSGGCVSEIAKSWFGRQRRRRRARRRRRRRGSSRPRSRSAR